MREGEQEERLIDSLQLQSDDSLSALPTQTMALTKSLSLLWSGRSGRGYQRTLDRRILAWAVILDYKDKNICAGYQIRVRSFLQQSKAEQPSDNIA